MKTLLVILACIIIGILIAMELVEDVKIKRYIRLSFFYVLFIACVISVVYLLVLNPILSATVFFIFSLIEICLVVALLFVWDDRYLRNIISRLSMFAFIWWVLTLLLYLFFG